ncbi:MAG: class I SAM-dependent methyltransferase [Mycobacteriales bacterium]
MPAFDLALFESLNGEYREKRVVPQPRSLAGSSLLAQAESRLTGVTRKLDIQGKRVLEIGCGRGHVGRVLADRYGCNVVGVDITSYDNWDEISDARLTLKVCDLATDDMDDLGTFDVIISFVVFEHVLHPFGMLTAVRKLLAPGGRTYISANLYRGAKASHRYREIFFPWPHLLFTDDVFKAYYKKHHGRANIPAWVNKMTFAHYRLYHSLAGLRPQELWLSRPFFDEPFYERFHDRLGRYPRFDLAHDFIYAILGRDDDNTLPAVTDDRSADALREGLRDAERTIQSLRIDLTAAQREIAALRDPAQVAPATA